MAAKFGLKGLNGSYLFLPPCILWQGLCQLSSIIDWNRNYWCSTALFQNEREKKILIRSSRIFTSSLKRRTKIWISLNANWWLMSDFNHLVSIIFKQEARQITLVPMWIKAWYELSQAVWTIFLLGMISFFPTLKISMLQKNKELSNITDLIPASTYLKRACELYQCTETTRLASRT